MTIRTLNLLIDTRFVNNTAINKSAHNIIAGTGGAVRKTGPKKLSVKKSVFLSNYADTYGGAVHYLLEVPGRIDSFTSENCTYANNEAKFGGALNFENPFSISTKHNLFQSNSALITGGAVFIRFGSQGISEADSFITNNCLQYGGAASLFNTQVFSITMGSFQGNSAEKGAAIYQTAVGEDTYEVVMMALKIKNTHFTKNQHSGENAGTVYIAQNILLQIEEAQGVIFSNNQGALYTSNSQITFQGDILLQNNTASQQGGAITCVQSTLTFEGWHTTRIIGNRANYGGGMSLNQCTVNMVGNMVIDSNWAGFSGGGIHSIQSTIKQGGDLNFHHNNNVYHKQHSTSKWGWNVPHSFQFDYISCDSLLRQQHCESEWRWDAFGNL